MTDISQHWEAGKAGWRRKLILIEYNEPQKKTQNQIQAENINPIQDIN